MAWPLAAMGIGALIGGMGAQQRGGSFLKGALTGAALGGATGWLGGGKAVAGIGGKGGLFGFGSKMLPNFLAMSGIGMGTEMFGQQEANKKALEGRRALFREEEEERLRRLSEIAGYNVADPSRFLTPNKFFGRAARGGYQSRPQYQLGGISSIDDDPANVVDIQELQMDPGTMGPGELVEEFDFMEQASSGGDESGWYEMFFNEFGRPPVDTNELQLFIDQIDISPTDVARGGGQEAMMAARGGRVKMRGGGRPDDYDDDDIRYDEDLIDIFEDDSAMFHGDYDVADEWKEGGIATVPRPEMFLGGALGLGALLGGAGLLGKIFGGRKKGERAPIKKLKEFKLPPGARIPPIDEEELPPHIMPLHGLLNRAKGGGIGDLDLRGGGASFGPGTGTSDDIPAMLSDGEFVVTADAVQNLGQGDRMLGARRMYSMMNQLDPNSQAPSEISGIGYA